MKPEVTVSAPQTVLTASQVRALLVEVEGKEQAAKVLTLVDVQPGQYFRFKSDRYTSPYSLFKLTQHFAHRSGQVDKSTVTGYPVELVRNFDGDPL